MAANIFTGATNSNWGTSTNWSLSAVPTASDGNPATFNAASPACTVNVTSVCNGLDFKGAGGTNYANTITMTSQLTVSGNVTFTSGMGISGAGLLRIDAASTIISDTKVWPNSVTFLNNNTKTLSDNWTITGTLTNSGTTVLNSNTITTGGLAGTSGMTGTTVISLASGTWSATGIVQNSITIAGNVTVSGTVAYQTGTLTYTSGTVTTTSSTLAIAASTTLNTAGISWNNITISATATLTLNSLLTSTNFTINTAVAVTFAGSFGFSVGTFTCSHTGANTQTFVNGVTYTITTAFNAFSSRVAAILIFTSDHASNKAILTLNNGATCNVLASFTRIDASGGRPILTFNGTVTTCFNVISYSDVQVPPSILIRKFGRRKQIYDRAKTVLYQIP